MSDAVGRFRGDHRMGERHGERPKQASGDDRLHADPVGMGGEDRRECRAVGHRAADLVVTFRAEMRQQGPHVDHASLDQHRGLDELRLERQLAVDRPNALSNGPWSSAASSVASSSSSLSAKTRKIVPSAMPAAHAICLVVIASPCSASKWAHGFDDRRAPFLGRKRRRPFGRGGSADGRRHSGDSN